jgi:hypothetical protein
VTILPFIAAASADRAFDVFAGILAAVFLFILIVYLRLCWKRGVVGTYGRKSSRKFSREWQPAQYWMIMSFYALLAVGIVLLFVIRLVRFPT